MYHFGVTTPGTETPINTSAPRASAVPVRRLRLVLKLSRPIGSASGLMMPERSQRMMSVTPIFNRWCNISTGRAAPLMTQRTLSICRHLKGIDERRAGNTAVPCWSSWNTGISHNFLSFFSISKQQGGNILRLIPPKLPDIRYIVLTISSTSLERMQSGKASTRRTP